MSEREPAAVLWDCLRGAMVTKALAIVADLKIADALAEGARPVGELAQQIGVDADALHRVLRALASDGVFAEHEPGVRLVAFKNVTVNEEFFQGHFPGSPLMPGVLMVEALTGVVPDAS